MLPVPVMDAVVRRATPKSMIFTEPSWLMKMFAGLMSRWTMPCLVRVGEPDQHLDDDRDLALDGQGRLARMVFWRSSPFRSSIAM